MKVKIYVYANKKVYYAIMMADNKEKSIKKIKKERKTESIMENYLLAVLAAFKSLKFPVDVHLVSPRRTFSYMPDYEKEIPEQDYIKENMKLWKELSRFIKKHKSYIANRHTDNEKDFKDWQSLHSRVFSQQSNNNFDKMDTLF
jgi:hypothetical protein